MYEINLSRVALLDGFIRYRKASGLWNNSYEKNLVLFDRFCKNNYPDEQGLTQTMVTEWLKRRITESVASCRARSQVVITLVKYLQLFKLTDITLPERMLHVKNIHLPHIFTTEEINSFFEKCDSEICNAPNKQKAFVALTSSVLFRLLYSSGIRTIEARLLKTSDIDWSEGVLKIVSTKGNQEHFVALHKDTQNMLLLYHTAAEKYIPGRTYFFPKGTDDIPISSNGLCFIFNKLWNRISDKNAVAYDFRHNYAITNINSWIGSGIAFHDKFLYLSKSMGHSTLENTKYYYTLVPQMADVIQQLSNQSFEEIIPEVPEYAK